MENPRGHQVEDNLLLDDEGMTGIISLETHDYIGALRIQIDYSFLFPRHPIGYQ